MVWDQHLNVYVDMLEKIQRRAARWIIGCYDRYSSVIMMLASLKWPTLALYTQENHNQVPLPDK